MAKPGKSTFGDALSEETRRKLEAMGSTPPKSRSTSGNQPVAKQQSARPAPSSPTKMTVGKKLQAANKTKAAVSRGMRLLGEWPKLPQEQDVSRIAQQTLTEPKPLDYWSLPAEASVRERPPHVISPLEKKKFKDTLAAAGKAQAPNGEDVLITVGIDLGTSSTKMVVRFPLEPGQPAIAIPAPPFCRSNDDPYLWQTVLWVRQSGEFTAWPEPGIHLIHTLKQALLAGRQDRPILHGQLDSVKATSSEAVAAYLSFVMRYIRGWLLTNRPKYFRNRTPVWTENIGFPTASLNDKALVEVFRRVGLAARVAADEKSPLTCGSIREAINSSKVLQAARSLDGSAGIGIAIIPETAAEVTGFFNSQKAAKGAYVLVDVGALTLDACFFRYSDSEYRIFNADVKPFGVESYHWFMSEGKAESSFEQQCDWVMRQVIWDGKNKFLRTARCWSRGNQLPVFLAGGGAQSEVHRKRVMALGPWLKEFTDNEGIKLLELPVPRTLDIPESPVHFGRLAVAWGLSFPADQIGEIIYPSELTELEPPKARQGPELVTKDMV